jgi:hypothetical protein
VIVWICAGSPGVLVPYRKLRSKRLGDREEFAPPRMARIVWLTATHNRFTLPLDAADLSFMRRNPRHACHRDCSLSCFRDARIEMNDKLLDALFTRRKEAVTRLAFASLSLLSLPLPAAYRSSLSPFLRPGSQVDSALPSFGRLDRLSSSSSRPTRSTASLKRSN